jgi:serine/threonine protein kinase
MMNVISLRCQDAGGEAPAPVPVGPRGQEPLPAEVRAAARDADNLIGRYILLRPLGRGGVGEIFLAWDPLRSRQVAIKRLRRDVQKGDPATRRDARDSLVREAGCARFLRHPGIVPVLDLAWAGEDPFLSLEYIPGRALDERILLALLEGWPSLYHQSSHSALRILEELARAIHHAHTAGRPVVHRDLKPGNIIIDPDGRPHLLDFGFAQVLDPSAEELTQVCGTPSYMAPEQARGNSVDIDVRTDIYGLGAIMYELVAGRPPITGESLMVLFRAATEPREPLGDVLRRIGDNPDYQAKELQQVPQALVDLCMACLEKEKDRRPESALAVAGLIEEIRESLPTSRAA